MAIINRKSDYGLRVLQYFASFPQNTVIDIRTISEETSVSPTFLQKICLKLAKSGILNSHRGIQGGFSLIKKPKDISFLDVIEILQGTIVLNQCFLDDYNCDQEENCAVRIRLTEGQKLYRSFLRSITFDSIIKENIEISNVTVS